MKRKIKFKIVSSGEDTEIPASLCYKIVASRLGLRKCDIKLL